MLLVVLVVCAAVCAVVTIIILALVIPVMAMFSWILSLIPTSHPTIWWGVGTLFHSLRCASVPQGIGSVGSAGVTLDRGQLNQQGGLAGSARPTPCRHCALFFTSAEAAKVGGGWGRCFIRYVVPLSRKESGA